MKYVSLILTICIGTSLFGQTTSSPYSLYGIGDVNPRSFGNQRSLAGAQTAAASPNYFNTVNPGTYGSIEYTTFMVDVNLDFRTIQSSTVTQRTNNNYFNNLAIVFPLGKRGGFGTSLRQYTKVGFNIEVPGTDPVLGDYTYNYDGKGGINELLIGAGYNLISDSNITLGVGANFLYYFGNAESNRRTNNFSDIGDALNANQKTQSQLKDIAFDAGLYFDYKINDSLKIGIGGSYSPSLNISGERGSIGYTYTLINSEEIIKDTTAFSVVSGNVVLPSSLNLGLALYVGKSWSLFADYKMQNWSEYEIFGVNQGLNDRTDLAFGVQFHPNATGNRQYHKRIQYRLGTRITETRLQVNNEHVGEYAFTAGLGLPVLSNNSKSTFNLGIEFGQRGENGVSLIKENFTNIFLGVSFNPHKFDGWFKKSKYN